MTNEARRLYKYQPNFVEKVDEHFGKISFQRIEPFIAT
jgi:hypothetical protein